MYIWTIYVLIIIIISYPYFSFIFVLERWRIFPYVAEHHISFYINVYLFWSNINYYYYMYYYDHILSYIYYIKFCFNITTHSQLLLWCLLSEFLYCSSITCHYKSFHRQGVLCVFWCFILHERMIFWEILCFYVIYI